MKNILRIIFFIIVLLAILLATYHSFAALTQQYTATNGDIPTAKRWNDEWANIYEKPNDYLEDLGISSGTITTITGNLVGDVSDADGVTISGTNTGSALNCTIQSSTVDEWEFDGYDSNNSAVSHTVVSGDLISNNYGNVITLPASETDSVTSNELQEAYRLDISGNYAYVVGGVTGSLISIDISDPTDLTIANYITHADIGGATDIVISGNYAYLSSSTTDTILSIDISNPTSLSHAYSLTDADIDSPTYADIKGNYLFAVNDDNDKVVSVDISTPTNLSVVSSFTHADISVPFCISINKNHAYITSRGNDKVVSVNISDPANMSFADSLSHANINDPREIVAVDDYAYLVMDDLAILTSIDISNPANLVYLNAASNAQLIQTRHLDINGAVAYTTSMAGGATVSAFNISSPGNLKYINSLSVAGIVNSAGIKIKGEYLFVATFLDDELLSIRNLGFTTNFLASPSVGNYFSFTHYGTESSGGIIFDPNDKNLNGNTAEIMAYPSDEETLGYNFLYVDESSGWIPYGHGIK